MPSVLPVIGFLVLAAGAVVETILASALLTALATTALLSVVSSKLFGPKAPKPAGFSGLQVLTRSAIEYRKIVYGQAIVSGPIYYNNTSGTDNEFLWYAIALVEGQSDDLVSVLFDNDVIPKADIDWAAGSGAADGTGTGDVSTSKWVGANSTKAVQIYYYLGDDLQPVSGDLNTAFADIGTNDRLRGVTHLICQLLYNEDTENVWKGGAPSNIRAVIKGRKLYDSRLDSTNGGTGTHRYTDSTTWAWSENPALCVADYLMNVMGVDPATSIDWPSVAATADDCEVSVAIPTASTEDRFTCNGALTLGSSHKDNLDSILSSMAGKLSYTGGVWKVRASVWEASSVSIDESDLAGDIDVRGSAPKSERFSTIGGFFIDPSRNYEAAEFPHISDSAYLARDNSEVISYDLQLPMTNTETMAQRIAFRNLEQGDNQIVAKLKMNARGAKIAIGDVVSFTFDSLSWSSKTFRCIEWVRNPDSTFSVTLKEDNSASYTDPIEGDYGTGNTGGVTLPADVIPPPTGLAATSVPVGIKLTWTNPPAESYDFIDIYEDTNDSWAGATKIARVRADTLVVPLDGGEVRYYWVRAVRGADIESLRSPDSDTTTVTATAGIGTVGADGNSVHVANVYKRSATAPSTPTADDGQFNFTTNTLTPPTGWSIDPPAGTDPLYVSTGTFSIQGVTGVDSTVTWSTTALLVQDGADGADGSDGAAGGDGLSVHVSNVYKRSATAPSTPAVDAGSYNFTTKVLTPPSGWSIDPPAGPDPLYVSTASWSITGTTGTDETTTWTAPALLVSDGITAVPDFTPGHVGGIDDFVYTLNAVVGGTSNIGEIRVQGVTFEHPDGTTITLAAADIAIHTSFEGTIAGRFYIMYSATNAETRFGEAVADWGAGSDTRFISVVHDAVNGWRAKSNSSTYYAFTPLSTDCIIAICDKLSTAGGSGIETIIPLTAGLAGVAPIVSSLTNQAHVVAADADGTNYSLTGAGGTHEVLEGVVDKTTSAVHSIVGGTDGGANWTKVQNGLTLTVVEATGVYSLSGASWTSDEETFTLRATYGGVTMDKVYTITKAKAGAAGGAGGVQLTGAALSDVSVSPTDSEVGYQLNGSGKEQSYEGFGSSYGPIDDWLLAGSIGDYDCRLTVDSGTAPAGSATGSWLSLSTVRSWTLTDSGVVGPVISNSCTIEIRHATTLTVLATATVTMSVHEEA